jgi:ubiquinone/menaquinone biosynthesis C-methylase UbiE
MDKIETKYLDSLSKYLNAFSTETHAAITTEFAPLKKSLHYIKERLSEKLTFLDLGCGIGNVLFTAKEILGKENNKYIGVDKNNYYVGIAQNIDLHFKVLNLDILSRQTLQLISTADVIFAYRPIPNCTEQKQSLKEIDLYTKKGAYFLWNDDDLPPDLPHMKILETFKGIECCSSTSITIYQKL